MVALDRWGALLNTPKTLACRRRELIGRDGAAPIVVGTGEDALADRLRVHPHRNPRGGDEHQGSPHEEFGQRFYYGISLVRVRTVEVGRPRSNAARSRGSPDRPKGRPGEIPVASSSPDALHSAAAPQHRRPARTRNPRRGRRVRCSSIGKISGARLRRLRRN